MPHLLPPGDNPNWILPGVRRLQVVGGFDDLMKLVFVCPKIESFEMESCRYWDHQSTERQQVIKETTAQLKDILLMLESKIEGFDRRIKELEAKSASLFDCPEFKQHPVSTSSS
jgi:hypothetical protein